MTDCNELWFPITLKFEEARYFLDQLESQHRNPKYLLFYLSAFVSSARSVTFHLEKQLAGQSAEHLAAYKATVKECLSGEFSKYFVGLRNLSLHQMYVPLAFSLVEPCQDDSGKEYLILRESSQPSSPSKKHFSWLEDVLKVDPFGASLNQAQWVLPDFPEKKVHLNFACEEYLQQLKTFVALLRKRTDALDGG